MSIYVFTDIYVLLGSFLKVNEIIFTYL